MEYGRVDSTQSHHHFVFGPCEFFFARLKSSCISFDSSWDVYNLKKKEVIGKPNKTLMNGRTQNWIKLMRDSHLPYRWNCKMEMQPH